MSTYPGAAKAGSIGRVDGSFVTYPPSRRANFVKDSPGCRHV